MKEKGKGQSWAWAEISDESQRIFRAKLCRNSKVTVAVTRPPFRVRWASSPSALSPTNPLLSLNPPPFFSLNQTKWPAAVDSAYSSSRRSQRDPSTALTPSAPSCSFLSAPLASLRSLCDFQSSLLILASPTLWTSPPALFIAPLQQQALRNLRQVGASFPFLFCSASLRACEAEGTSSRSAC